MRELIAASWAWLRSRVRMIGRCPPHRYRQGVAFCLDCGEYDEERLRNLRVTQ